MSLSIENTLRQHSQHLLSDCDLELLMDGTPNSRHSKVKRLIQQGKLIHIKRGLYLITELLGHNEQPHSFEIAQRIYSPSYISFESALSYHQLIPERVYTTTCACTKRSKEFHTPLGIFSYLQLPTNNFFIEVELITYNNYHFFMAKPWKAICDYVYSNHFVGDNFTMLLENLRINKSDLPLIKNEELDILDDYYQRKYITKFIKNIKRAYNI